MYGHFCQLALFYQFNLNFLVFLEAVEVVKLPVQESGILGISACLEYFRNVGCEVTSHNKGEITKLTIKARYTKGVIT